MGEQTLGERLEWIRTRYFDTQQQMADAMGCGSSYLTKILKPGDHKVSTSLLVNLSEAVKQIALSRGEDCPVNHAWIVFGGELVIPIREQAVPYRTMPSLQAGILLRGQKTPDLVESLSGLLRDEGVPIPARLEAAEVLFDEIKRRLRESLSSDRVASALLAKAVSGVEAASPSGPASARGGLAVPPSDDPRKPPAPQSKH